MHIAVVTRNMCAGGVERVIAQLLHAWDLKGIQCSLVCVHPQPAFYHVDDVVAIYEIPLYSKKPYIDKLKKYLKLRCLMKTLRPDVVLAMPEEIGVFVIMAMLGTGIPVVVSERNNPWVMPNKKITRLLRRMAYPFAKGLIFQTEQAAEFFPRKQREKGIVLPNPLELSRLPEVYAGPRRKIVVGAGRLDQQKNFPLLIRAFAKFYETHRDYKLVIFGEGKQRAELESLASGLLPDGVWRLPGRVQDLPEQIRDCAMFVLSSDYEGVPNVVIEAMAVGVPVISTDCAPGGAASLIQNEENGILVSVGDEKALADAMAAVADEPVSAKTKAAKAVGIRDVLDAGKVSDQWLDYLRKCAGK